MKRMTRALTALLVVAVLGGPAQAETFYEVGDAGPPADPMPLGPPGMAFDSISGTLGGTLAGGAIDTSDAFLFYFSGGEFAIEGVLHLTGNPADDLPLVMALYHPPDPATPLFSSTDGLLDVGLLVAGNYILDVAFDVAADPPIWEVSPRLDLEDFLKLLPPRPTPAPPSLALLILGVLGLGWHLRRR